MTAEDRAGGLEKAAEIARYHRDKYNNYGCLVPPSWIAACNEIEVSCLATAQRIRRGEYEDPVSDVMKGEFP